MRTGTELPGIPVNAAELVLVAGAWLQALSTVSGTQFRGESRWRATACQTPIRGSQGFP